MGITTTKKTIKVLKIILLLFVSTSCIALYWLMSISKEIKYYLDNEEEFNKKALLEGGNSATGHFEFVISIGLLQYGALVMGISIPLTIVYILLRDFFESRNK